MYQVKNGTQGWEEATKSEVSGLRAKDTSNESKMLFNAVGQAARVLKVWKEYRRQGPIDDCLTVVQMAVEVPVG